MNTVPYSTFARRSLAAVTAMAFAGAAAASDTGSQDLYHAAKAHIHAFERIAREHGNDRSDGSPGFEASAAYVETVLRQAGYRPWRQYFHYAGQKVHKKRAATNVPQLAQVLNRPVAGTPATPAGGIRTLVASLGPHDGCHASDWEGRNVRDTILLMPLTRSTQCSLNAQLIGARQHGALAVVTYVADSNRAEPYEGLGDDGSGALPATIITGTDAHRLHAALERGKVTMHLDLASTQTTLRSFNVLAEKVGSTGAKMFMAGAHLDSVPDSPGVEDNAAGSALVLASAVSLANLRHPQTLRFAWWGAEEVGLEGSRHFVAQLTPLHQARLAGYFNFDAVASPNPIIGVYETGRHDPASLALQRAFTVHFDRTDQAWIPCRNVPRSSDSAAFLEAGIPVGGLCAFGDHGTKTFEEQQLFGGESGQPYSSTSHTPQDDLDHISWDAVRTFAPAVRQALDTLANDG